MKPEDETKLIETLGEIKSGMGEIRSEQRSQTTKLTALQDMAEDTNRAIYGSNGKPGIAGAVDKHDLRIETVEKNVDEMKGDRKKLVFGVILAFVGAAFSWARSLIPGNSH